MADRESVESLHPDPASIAAFVAGKLTGEPSASIAKHLDTCASCREVYHAQREMPGMNTDGLSHKSDTASPPAARPSDTLPDSGWDSRAVPDQPSTQVRFSADGELTSWHHRPMAAAAEHHPQTASGIPFDDYELIEEIASGGMGIVYKARQVKLNRLVALKMIKAGQLADDHDVRRFYTEAEAAARLDHPGIVPIYEVGNHQGRHFYSMAFVEGESLEKRISGTPLPAREAADLLKRIAEAIAYAHSQGVIHRDLKPANVLLDEAGQPKVADFGLAKNLQAESDLTHTGMVMGTPSYMPPEQAQGDPARIGPRSDIYSLGAILYCMLTGRPPFKAATPLDTLRLLLEHEPIAPRQLTPQTPQDLETICLKCLSKDPGGRYATADELAEELGRYLRGEPIHARPIGPFARAWRWCRRNRAVASLAGAVMVVLLAGIGVSSYFAHAANIRAKEARMAAEVAQQEKARADAKANEALAEKRRADEAARLAQAETAARQEALENETRQRQYAEAVADFVEKDLLALTSVEGQLRLGGQDHDELLTRDTTLRELLDRAADKLRQRTDLAPETEARLCQIIGVSYRANGDAAKAIPFFQRAIALRQEHLGPEHRRTLESMNSLAVAYSSAGQRDKALALYEQTFALSQSALGEDHPFTLIVMENLASAYKSAGQLDKSLPLYEQALALIQARLGEHHPQALICMSGVAGVYLSVGRSEEAQALMERTLALMKAKLGEDHPQTLTTMNNLSHLYHQTEQLDKALPLYEQTLALTKASLGEDHPLTLTGMHNLASGYSSAGQLDKALPLFEKTVALRKVKLGDSHHHTLLSIIGLAHAYDEARQMDKALSLWKQTFDVLTAKLGEGHPQTLTYMSNLAYAYRRTGQTDQALSLYKRAFALTKARLGEEHPETLSRMHNLAAGYRFAQQFEQALPLYEKVYALRKARLGEDHPETLRSMNSLGNCYWSLKQLDRSIPLFEETLRRRTAILGREHRDTLISIANLGVNYEAAGRVDEAMVLFKEVARHIPKHPDLKWVQQRLDEAQPESE